MTWQDALEFSLWLDSKKKGLCKSYRLPSKAEWLSAANASADAVGVVAEEGRASCRGCGAGRDEGEALPVATLPADPLGTHDINGNLWEWVDDGPACGFADLRENNICSGEGTVMGGSFATAAASLTRDLEGHHAAHLGRMALQLADRRFARRLRHEVTAKTGREAGLKHVAGCYCSFTRSTGSGG